MPVNDPLLLTTLRDLRSAVDRVQDGQDKMRDRLDEVGDHLDTKLTAAITPLAARVTALEAGREDLKRDARKWGAIGGASAVLTAGITAVIGLFTKGVKG